jgi:lipopolysaccharide export system permease protein
VARRHRDRLGQPAADGDTAGATNPRRPGAELILALLAFVVYFNLINISQAWVASRKASLGAMLLALHGGSFVLALAALWWRDHASTAGLPRLRRSAAA